MRPALALKTVKVVGDASRNIGYRALSARRGVIHLAEKMS